MNRLFKQSILPLIAICFAGLLFASEKQVQLNEAFYISFSRHNLLGRDQFLSQHLNKIIFCKGKILSSGKYHRYNKKYRVILRDVTADKINIEIIYYLFFEDAELYSKLKKNDLYEFSGQLMLVTPASIKRDAYICDLVLGKGAVVVN